VKQFCSFPHFAEGCFSSGELSAFCRRSFFYRNGFRHFAEGRFFTRMAFGVLPKVVFLPEWLSAWCRRSFFYQNGFRRFAEGRFFTRMAFGMVPKVVFLPE